MHGLKIETVVSSRAEESIYGMGKMDTCFNYADMQISVSFFLLTQPNACLRQDEDACDTTGLGAFLARKHFPVLPHKSVTVTSFPV